MSDARRIADRYVETATADGKEALAELFAADAVFHAPDGAIYPATIRSRRSTTTTLLTSRPSSTSTVPSPTATIAGSSSANPPVETPSFWPATTSPSSTALSRGWPCSFGHIPPECSSRRWSACLEGLDRQGGRSGGTCVHGEHDSSDPARLVRRQEERRPGGVPCRPFGPKEARSTTTLA